MPRSSRRINSNESAAKKKSSKKAESAKRSDSAGMKLADDDDWANGWTLWTSFRAEKGHGDVPDNHSNKELVKWVKRQQEDYTNWKEGNTTFLSSDGFRMLTRMGFVWEYDKRTGSKKKTSCQSEPTEEQQHAALPIGGAKPNETGGTDTKKEVKEESKTGSRRSTRSTASARGKGEEAEILSKRRQTRSTANSQEPGDAKQPDEPDFVRRSTRSNPIKEEKPPVKSTPLKKRLARTPAVENESASKNETDDWDSHFQELLDYVGPGKSMADVQVDSDLGIWMGDVRESYVLFGKGQTCNLTKERVDLLRSIDFDFEKAPADRDSKMPPAKEPSHHQDSTTATPPSPEVASDAVGTATASLAVATESNNEGGGSSTQKPEDTMWLPQLKKSSAVPADATAAAAASTADGVSIPTYGMTEEVEDRVEMLAFEESNEIVSPKKRKAASEKGSGPPKKRLPDPQVHVQADTFLASPIPATPQGAPIYKKEMNTDPTPGPMELDPSLIDKSRVLQKEKEFTDEEYRWLTSPGEPFEPDPEKRISPLQAEYNRRWHKNFCELVEFKKLHGHTLIPKTYPPNKTLAMFVYRMRSEKRSLDRGDRTSLNDYRLSKLKAINFSWTSKGQPDFWKFKLDTKSALNDGWEEKFQQLVAFKELNGNVLVPKKFPPNQSLSSWVQRQRAMYRFRKLGKKNSMTDNRMQRLEDLGFVWNSKMSKEHLRFANLRPHEDTFNKHFQKLVKFKEEHGHTWVPKEWKKDVQLARFVGKMRTTRRRMLGKEPKHGTTEDNETDPKPEEEAEVDFNLQIMQGRIKRLDEMGFIWNEEGAKSYEDWVRKSKSENTEIKSPGYNSGRKGGNAGPKDSVDHGVVKTPQSSGKTQDEKVEPAATEKTETVEASVEVLAEAATVTENAAMEHRVEV